MFDEVVLQKVGGMLLCKRHTLAVAESFTAGLLQVAFTSAENASLYFRAALPLVMQNKIYASAC
ncbi:MAG: Competence-damaged protein [Ferruginibacter sp.]|uniref:CinA family protein n=1 Tax=Ferruginibacter sp. TaxID=1940288 RepID=UPI00265944A1|nr:CinA family protein [Ferruginibacter sp.]MDB5278594.1 Competence-damaged protein [Ferruginibacter sp.]